MTVHCFFWSHWFDWLKKELTEIEQFRSKNKNAMVSLLSFPLIQNGPGFARPRDRYVPMEETDNHQTKAADILGISERMLRYKLKKYGLK